MRLLSKAVRFVEFIREGITKRRQYCNCWRGKKKSSILIKTSALLIAKSMIIGENALFENGTYIRDSTIF